LGAATVETWQIALLVTPIGWCGVAGRGESILRITIGHPAEEDVRREILGWDGAFRVDPGWKPRVVSRLAQFAQGERVDFDDIHLALPALTAFQRAVVEATRKIGYGETRTYGALALEAGFPRAARAVGSVMAANRFPIVIPCHRVIGSAGRLVGYSAPRGTCLKQLLLDMEAEHAAAVIPR
jgi:methylated-DNA-[protein]-cysteine S-methyltransferase